MTAVRIGDQVIDAAGDVWTVLGQPDGSGLCDGLFRRETPAERRGGQQYGEHIPGPLVVWSRK